MTDRCGHTWGACPPADGQPHVCAADPGHDGGHVCRCGHNSNSGWCRCGQWFLLGGRPRNGHGLRVCFEPEPVVPTTDHDNREETNMTNPNDTAIEVLARRRLELTARRDEIVEAIKQVDSAMLTLLQPGEAATVDGQPVWVVRSGNRRFSEDKAREVLPETLVESITVTETHLSGKVAKEILPPALYASACTTGRPFVAKA